MKKFLAFVLALTLCASPAMAAVYEGQRVRIVIGSTSVSGDSYMIADIVNRYLQKYLKCSSKVDPVGANEALATIRTAAPDGLTFMIFHDMTYLGVLFGSYGSEYALENMVVGPRVGQNPGSCFAAKAKAPYSDLKEMTEWLKANPDKTVRLSVELGGVSQIAFISYYMWVKEVYGDDVAGRIRFVLGGSTDTKLQQIWDGNTDVIFADYSSLLQYTAAGVDEQLALKYVGMLDNIPGKDNLPVYGKMGITMGGKPFYFAKDFLIYLPKGTPDNVLAELDDAVAKMSADPQFKEDMAKMTYAGNTLASKEAREFIYGKRDAIAKVLAEAPDMEDLE
ncbi:MAG: hypothetical protein K6E38_05265 [Fretibacterium sp.]|nr:hypothetical protein [Fretibacterium sp.]